MRNSELIVLDELGYLVYTEQPHEYLVTFLKILDAIDLLQDAWLYLNDIFLTWACVHFTTTELVVAAIFLADREKQFGLPLVPPWYDMFDAKLANIYKVISALFEVYALEMDPDSS